MKKLSLLIALLVMLPSPVLAQWQWVNPKPTGENLWGWSAVNDQVHVVWCQNNFVLKTTDGGVTWSGRYAEGVTFDYPPCFADSSVGYAILNEDGQGRVLKTTDGGVTWQEIYRDPYVTELQDIRFLDANHGFVVGQHSERGLAGVLHWYAYMLSTSDGGSTWARHELPPRSQFQQKIVFAGNTAVLDLDYWRGDYCKSTDGGASWVWGGSLPGFYFRDLFFVNETVGYALTEGNTGGVRAFYLAKTTDGGESWTPTRRLDGNACSLFFQREGTGVIVGDRGFDGRPLIYRTVDDGASLQPVASLDWYPLVTGTPSGPLFAFGYGGRLLRSTDGGSSWTDMQTRVLPSDAPLFQGGLVTSSQAGYLFDGASVYTTSDFGSTWRKTLSDATNLRGLSFPSAQVGYAVGDGLWKTTNGGATWAGLPGPGFSSQAAQFLTDDLGFAADAQSYSACGGYGGSGGGENTCPSGLHVTTDGGATWNAVLMPPAASSYRLSAFHFPTAEVGYVCRFNGDSGRSEIWKLVNPADPATITSERVSDFGVNIQILHFRDETSGLASDRGAVFRTSDGGRTWQEVLNVTGQSDYWLWDDWDQWFPTARKILYDQGRGIWWLFADYACCPGGGEIWQSRDGSSWDRFWSPAGARDIFLHPHGLWGLFSGRFDENALLACAVGEVGPVPPDTPVNLAPPNGTGLPQPSVTLKASSFSDRNPEDTHLASQWQIATDSGFTGTVLDSAPDPTNLTTYTVTAGLAYDQTYYFRVRHEDSTGLWSDWSQPTSFFINHPPDTPSANPALLPPDSVFYTTSPTIVFSDYHDQEGDPHRATEVRVSRGPDCDQLVWGTVLSGAVTQAIVPAGLLQYGETYCIHVRYQDGNMLWSEWSAPEQIKVSSGPRQPVNQRPAVDAETDSVQLEASAFTDDFAAQGASHWQICRGEDFLCIVYEVENTTGDLIRLTPPNVFVSERTYSWHVRYRNVHGVWSPWSQPTSFTFVPSP
jgi:photosystem II stability/assembly factor-like uncharacterized protein